MSYFSLLIEPGEALFFLWRSPGTPDDVKNTAFNPCQHQQYPHQQCSYQQQASAAETRRTETPPVGGPDISVPKPLISQTWGPDDLWLLTE